MKKRNYTFVFFALLNATSYAQQTQTSSIDYSQRYAVPVTPITNQQRYKIDYELKNYTFENGDSTILNNLDLDYYDSMRLEDQDLEVYNEFIHQTIIIYSKIKTHNAKDNNNNHPSQPTNLITHEN